MLFQFYLLSGSILTHHQPSEIITDKFKLATFANVLECKGVECPFNQKQQRSMINFSVHLLDDDHPVIGAVGLLLQLERVPLDDNAAARDQDHIHRAHLHNGLPFKEGIYIYKNAKCI